MKRFIGVILLSGTFTLLPAGQEEVTGRSLKTAIQEEQSAVSSFWRREVNESRAEAYLNAYEEILHELDKEGMTIENIKKHFKKRSDDSEKDYNKAKDRYKIVKEKLDIAKERADKQIEMAAKKLG